MSGNFSSEGPLTSVEDLGRGRLLVLLEGRTRFLVACADDVGEPGVTKPYVYRRDTGVTRMEEQGRDVRTKKSD